MEVNLSAELKAFIDQQVASGVFASSDEVIAQGLHVLRIEQEEDEKAIQKGLDDVKAGRVHSVYDVFSRLEARYTDP